jgi:geranylgeranyl diphosphate synthase type I
MPNHLPTLSQEMIPAVEEEMRAVLRADEKSGDPFFGMMHYHLGWADEAFRPVTNKSGKRVRPLICLLVTRAAGGDWQQAVPAAASLELLHNFTLIHDDIQDSSPTRRGRTTLWRHWGANQAINSGDAMFATAHLAMVRLQQRGVSPEIVVEAVRRLDETCIDLTIGQFEDMSFEHQSEVSVQEYLGMIDGKTAALISLAAELGALIAPSGPASIQHFATFGRDLGLAFQVRDDILGIWGDESIIGKSSATDIETRKKSLPVLYGLARSEELRRLYEQPHTDSDFIDRVIQLLDEVGARDFAEKCENDYAQSAVNHLAATEPRGSSSAALHQLTSQLLNREA